MGSLNWGIKELIRKIVFLFLEIIGLSPPESLENAAKKCSVTAADALYPKRQHPGKENGS
jgi:hypothetical protein